MSKTAKPLIVCPLMRGGVCACLCRQGPKRDMLTLPWEGHLWTLSRALNFISFMNGLAMGNFFLLSSRYSEEGFSSRLQPAYQAHGETSGRQGLSGGCQIRQEIPGRCQVRLFNKT